MASSYCTYLFHFELVGGRSPRLRNFRVDLRAPIFSPFELFAPCFISHSDNDGNVSPQLQLQIKYKTLLVPFCFTFPCICVRRASLYKYRPMATNHEMNRELGVGGVASFCQRQNASNGRYGVCCDLILTKITNTSYRPFVSHCAFVFAIVALFQVTMDDACECVIQ